MASYEGLYPSAALARRARREREMQSRSTMVVQQQGNQVAYAKLLAEQQEKQAKKVKDAIDFYRTAREYLTPGEAFKATKEYYPDFSNVFAGSQDQPDYQRELQKINLIKAQGELEYSPIKRAREAEEFKMKKIKTKQDLSLGAKRGKYIEAQTQKVLRPAKEDPFAEMIGSIVEEGGKPEATSKSPYKEYPDAFQENGIWKVVRGGKKYKIQD